MVYVCAVLSTGILLLAVVTVSGYLRSPELRSDFENLGSTVSKGQNDRYPSWKVCIRFTEFFCRLPCSLRSFCAIPIDVLYNHLQCVCKVKENYSIKCVCQVVVAF